MYACEAYSGHTTPRYGSDDNLTKTFVRESKSRMEKRFRGTPEDESERSMYVYMAYAVKRRKSERQGHCVSPYLYRDMSL